MSVRGGAALYTPEILALAVELADYPLDPQCAFQGEARSRICGGRVVVSLEQADRGAIHGIGARVSACAVGQAAAALFLRSAEGRGDAEIAKALTDIEAWLAGSDTVPAWPDIEQLASARSYPARHPAILLPWKAALAALSNPSPAV